MAVWVRDIQPNKIMRKHVVDFFRACCRLTSEGAWAAVAQFALSIILIPEYAKVETPSTIRNLNQFIIRTTCVVFVQLVGSRVVERVLFVGVC